MEDFGLPVELHDVTGQTTVPIGIAALVTPDASIAADLTAPLVIEAAPVEKPSSRQITYGPDAGVFLFDPSKDQEKDLKPV